LNTIAATLPENTTTVPGSALQVFCVVFFSTSPLHATTTTINQRLIIIFFVYCADFICFYFIKKDLN
jgi:hypothetical protein